MHLHKPIKNRTEPLVLYLAETKGQFIIYKVMQYRKKLMKYNVYFILSLVKL